LKEFTTIRGLAAVLFGAVLLVAAGCNMSSKTASPGPSPSPTPVPSPTPTPTPSPSAHSVALTWSASSSSGVIGYNVYRSTTASGSYTRVGNVVGTSFTDSTVQGGHTYFYTVTTVNSANLESAPSSPISATVPST
jgi:hypothetical protein